ncbi:MAG: hypothetical protein M3546_11235 [Actinomycetota bacterium]|nr:hypothetical protein [Actinomycetota bacterium]
MEDLGLPVTATFADALTHGIVRGFQAKRHQTPIGSKTVGPDAGAYTLYRVGMGHDNRGASWFDPTQRVVWLCAAAGVHRSGSDDDFFQQVKPLIASGDIYPVEADIRRLLGERELRFAELGPIDAERIVAAGRQSPGEIVLGVLAGQVPVRVLVEPGVDLDSVYVAFATHLLVRSPKRLNGIVRCFDPKGELDPDYPDGLPGEPHAPGEFVMLIVRSAAVA